MRRESSAIVGGSEDGERYLLWECHGMERASEFRRKLMHT